MIDKVKRCEVRRQGAGSQVRRPFEYDEFMHILDLLQRYQGFPFSEKKRYEVATIFSLQW